MQRFIRNAFKCCGGLACLPTFVHHAEVTGTVAEAIACKQEGPGRAQSELQVINICGCGVLTAFAEDVKGQQPLRICIETCQYSCDIEQRGCIIGAVGKEALHVDAWAWQR